MQVPVSGEQLFVRVPVAQVCALLHVASVEMFTIGSVHVTPLGVPHTQGAHVAGGATSEIPPSHSALAPPGHEGTVVSW